MEVGIGLPNAVRGVDRTAIVDWSRRAEAAGFSSLGTLDRIAYPNYESLITLAAAAAVTERVRLITDILIAPLRANTALFAKQAATIDALSGGRLTLGLAVGGRTDDYEVSEVDFNQRGRKFERQLQQMTAIWAGETDIGPVPPQGGRPGLLIGGQSDAAFRRAATYGDGWTMGGGGPDALAGGLEKLNAAWSEAGREGKPRTAALFYFALGNEADQMANESLGHYYSFLGPDIAQQIVASAAKDVDTVKQRIAGFDAAGADELICFPASTDLEQIDRLAEAVFG
ncbi:MAG TPA: LLM class flavin-dependent oxidoreductase [Solirubrobacteraceae bacterium]|nr:LLM class flavin-dependent oxidoreductase [Solirubrobacteraceae bacterium]